MIIVISHLIRCKITMIMVRGAAPPGRLGAGVPRGCQGVAEPGRGSWARCLGAVPPLPGRGAGGTNQTERARAAPARVPGRLSQSRCPLCGLALSAGPAELDPRAASRGPDGG